MHETKCPLTLQEAKPTAGSHRSSQATDADRGSERSPKVDATLSPADAPHRGLTPVSSRPPDENQSGGRGGTNDTRARSHGNVCTTGRREQTCEGHIERNPTSAVGRVEGRTCSSDQAARSGPRPRRTGVRAKNASARLPESRWAANAMRRRLRVVGSAVSATRTGSTGRPRTARSSRRREPATGRLPVQRARQTLGRSSRSGWNATPARPPPRAPPRRVRSEKRKPARASSATRSATSARVSRGNAEAGCPTGRPPADRRDAARER